MTTIQDPSGIYVSDNFVHFMNEITQLPIKMGSMTPQQGAYLMDFLRSHPEIKHVLETGFHIGMGTSFILESRPDISVTSFDIFWFDYTRKAKLLLDIAFPGRNLLLAGNSISSLPTFFARFPCYKPDMVFIDGGHERPVPLLDLHYILSAITPGTWVMVDDYCEAHGEGGVNEAVDKFIADGVLEQVQAYRAADRGWIMSRRSMKHVVPLPLATDEAELDKLRRDVISHY
jgi:predicted O-methyltransferase YrrM